MLPDNVRGILQKKSPCATAGYIEEEKNKELFTEDGWIHTGDVAVRYSDGRYRVFGRATDCFRNQGITYPMYDIEECVLKHVAVAEAEVVKFEVEGEEYPAMVVVVKSNWQDRLTEVLKELCAIDVQGMEHLIGIRFVDKFKTNPVTSKRDYLSLQEEKSGYYSVDAKGKVYVTEVGCERVEVEDEEIKIVTV